MNQVAKFDAYPMPRAEMFEKMGMPRSFQPSTWRRGTGKSPWYLIHERRQPLQPPSDFMRLWFVHHACKVPEDHEPRAMWMSELCTGFTWMISLYLAPVGKSIFSTFRRCLFNLTGWPHSEVEEMLLWPGPHTLSGTCDLWWGGAT